MHHTERGACLEQLSGRLIGELCSVFFCDRQRTALKMMIHSLGVADTGDSLDIHIM